MLSNAPARSASSPYRRRVRHDERVGGRALAEAERNVERVSMNGRKLRRCVEGWEQHLVQAGEAHRGL
jgi:hypothetical protein